MAQYVMIPLSVSNLAGTSFSGSRLYNYLACIILVISNESDLSMKDYVYQLKLFIA